jgi:hypothetical protein
VSGVEPQLFGRAPAESPPSCRTCGCTEANCAACVEKTGAPCFWVEPDLCSACAPPDAVTRARVVNLAFGAVEAISQIAQLLEQYAVPPRNELGLVVSRSIELFERLDLSEAPDHELTRWAALAAITAGHAAQTMLACLAAIAHPEAGRRALAAVAPNPIPASGQPPSIVAPGGGSAGGGLVDLAGRPLRSEGG